MTMNIIALDTETGGLNAHENALLAVGGCCSWNGSAIDLYITAESQPTKKVGAAAVAKNGYDAEVWKKRGAASLDTSVASLHDWLCYRLEEKPDAVVVCHNLVHDLPFLRAAAQACGVDDVCPKIHRYAWRCSQQRFLGLMDEGLIESGSSSLDRLAGLSMWRGQRAAEHWALQDAQIALHGWQWMSELVAEKRKGAVA